MERPIEGIVRYVRITRAPHTDRVGIMYVGPRDHMGPLDLAWE